MKLPCAAAVAAALVSSSKPPPRSRATPALIGDAYAALGICAAPYRLSLHGRAARFERRCRDRGLRVVVSPPDRGSLGARIRDHRLVPYQAIIGTEEAAAGEVALRLRHGRRLARMSAAEALDRIEALLAVHSAELWDVG